MFLLLLKKSMVNLFFDQYAAFFLLVRLLLLLEAFYFILFFKKGSHYIAHAGLKLFSLSHPPASVSQLIGITGGCLAWVTCQRLQLTNWLWGSSVPIHTRQLHPSLWICLKSSPPPRLFAEVWVIFFFWGCYSYEDDLFWLECQGGWIFSKFLTAKTFFSSLPPNTAFFLKLPLQNEPWKTTSKLPAAWQLKCALVAMSIIPLLPDSELLICWGKKRKKKHTCKTESQKPPVQALTGL